MPKIKKSVAIPMLALGAGVAVGYVVGNVGGSYETIRPRIDLTPPSLPAGQLYTMTLTHFPPNTQLVAPVSLSSPTEVVNVGTTDANGKLMLVGVTAQGPAGTYYLIIWDAPTGKYVAMYTLIVT